MKQKNLNKRGFTLVEAMLAVVILAIASGSILLPFIGAENINIESQRMTLAVNLGQSLLNEILADDFADVISDYDGYSETQGQVLDSQGSRLDGFFYKGLSRSVECKTINLAESENGATAQAIIVTVNVFNDGDKIVSLSGLKGS